MEAVVMEAVAMEAVAMEAVAIEVVAMEAGKVQVAATDTNTKIVLDFHKACGDEMANT